MEVALTSRRKQVLDIQPKHKNENNYSTIIKMMNINCLSVSKNGYLPDALMELIKSYCFYNQKIYISKKLVNIFQKSRSRYTMTLQKVRNKTHYETIPQWSFLAYKNKRALKAINCDKCGDYASIRMCASRIFYNEGTITRSYSSGGYDYSYVEYEQLNPMGWLEPRCICDCPESEY